MYLFDLFYHMLFPYLYATAVLCEPQNPCDSNPCGSNSICRERNGVGSCVCMTNYIGDPYLGCRPECVQNSDCPFNKACINARCENPCIGLCDANAECVVVNHFPMCHCLPGYTGNPQYNCHSIPENSKQNRLDCEKEVSLKRIVLS